MIRTIIFSFIACACVAACSREESSQPKPPPLQRKPIVISRRPLVNPYRPVRLSPGAPAPIDAWIEGETLSMTFLTDLGEAKVTVSADMSAWSVTETFDTADGTLLLTVADDPGDYTITVATPEACYAGAYSVE